MASPARLDAADTARAVHRAGGCSCAGKCACGPTGGGGEHHASARHTAVLRLQRAAGNRAVRAMIQRAPGETSTEHDEVQHSSSGTTPGGGSVSVTGVTHATYTHRWNPGPMSVNTVDAENCETECPDERFPCSTASADMIGTYQVNTNVSLPSADIEGLPECERGVLASWIRTTLNDHEQEHVAAYEAYRGTTRRRFTVTGCRNEVADMLTAAMDEAHTEEEEPRREACDTASANLDPFTETIDFSACEPEEEAEGGEGGEESGGGEVVEESHVDTGGPGE